MFYWLIDFKNVNPFRVISCQEVWKSRSLYLYIFCFIRAFFFFFFFFAQSYWIWIFFNRSIWQMGLPLGFSGPGVMAKSPVLKSHYQKQFSVIPRTLFYLASAWDTVSSTDRTFFKSFFQFKDRKLGAFCGVLTKVLECSLEVSEFELSSH